MILRNVSAYDLPKEFEKQISKENLTICSPNLERRYLFSNENRESLDNEIYDFIADKLDLSRDPGQESLGGIVCPQDIKFLQLSTFIAFVRTAILGMGDACLLVNETDMRGLYQNEAMRLVDLDYATYIEGINQGLIEGAEENETMEWNAFQGRLNIHATAFIKKGDAYEFSFITFKVLHRYILDLVSEVNDYRVMKMYPHEYGRLKKATTEYEEEWPLMIKGGKKKVRKIKEVNEYVDTYEDVLSMNLKRRFRDQKLQSAWIIDDTRDDDHPHHTIVLSDMDVLSNIRLRNLNADMEPYIAPQEELEDLVIEYMQEATITLADAFKHV